MKDRISKIALFVLLCALSGLFLGALLSRFFIPEDAGLVGGAMVMGYAATGFLIALILGIVLWRFFSEVQLKVINSVLGVFCIGFIAWMAYRAISIRSAESTRYTPPVRQDSLPDPATTVPPVEPKAETFEAVSIGIGMARPVDMQAGKVILLYNRPTESHPVDSLIFENGPYHLLVKAATSLTPEVMKLDHQLIFFLVKDKKDDFLEIEVDKKEQRTLWVHTQAMDLLTWPHFLATVHSVEPMDWNSNPVRGAPKEEAAVLPGIGRGHILQAKAVSGDWLSVSVMDQEYRSVGKGWVRWRKEGELVVRYNLLS